MRKLIFYHSIILIPFLGILWWMKTADEPGWSVIALFVYMLIYRPITDGLKLKRKGIITKKEFIKSFIPFYLHNKVDDWFKELYLKP